MTERYPFGRLLDALDSAPPFALLAVLTAHLKETVDAQGATLLLADYAERRLERLDEGRPVRSGESFPVDGSPRAGCSAARRPSPFPRATPTACTCRSPSATIGWG